MDRAASEAALVRRCREVGLKVTPQRLAIYGSLAGRDDHPSPEQLYAAVSPALPSLSLATVYKTLESLVGAGLAREVVAPGGIKRFDANTERHHHRICTRCGRISDFVDERCDAIAVPAVKDFVAEEVSVQVLGWCKACGPDRNDREGKT